MKLNRRTSGAQLFLLELLFSILILALCSTVCIRLFAISWENRKEARELNHMQELLTNVSELFEAGDGSAEFLLQYLPDGTIDNESILYYYDSDWTCADPSSSVYEMKLVPSCTADLKAIRITFFSNRRERQEVLFETEVRYPVCGKEGLHEKTE